VFSGEPFLARDLFEDVAEGEGFVVVVHRSPGN
jgi:hypothetical protein